MKLFYFKFKTRWIGKHYTCYIREDYIETNGTTKYWHWDHMRLADFIISDSYEIIKDRWGLKLPPEYVIV